MDPSTLQPGALLTDVDIKQQLAVGAAADLVIENSFEDSITPVGYDVAAGDKAFSLNKKRRLRLDAGPITIEPNDTVFIASHENFKLSNRLGGFTASRLSPLLDGLDMTTLTVDPTWKGKLLIILTNHGRRAVKIREKDKLMTLVLFWVAAPSAKKAERKYWDDDAIDQRFKEMEQEARAQLWKTILREIATVAVLLLGSLTLVWSKVLDRYADAFNIWLLATLIYLTVIKQRP